MNDPLSASSGTASPPAAAVRHTRIQATRGLSALGLHELWEYRDLLWFQVIKEIKGKYRQMALGPLWIVIQPLLNMLVFTFVFGGLAGFSGEGVPYHLITLAALIPWTFFLNATMLSSACLVTEMDVISKVYFPRLIIPMSYVIGRLVDFCITFAILAGMLAFAGFWPDARWLLIPFYVLLAVVFTIALSSWTASLTVKFRDVKFVVQYGLQIAMFLTAVPFPAAELPAEWMWLFKLNPMLYVVEGFRWCLLGVGQGPELYMLWSIGITFFFALTGIYIFRWTERTIVDLL